MKKLILCIFAISAFVLSASTANAVYVRGHYRSDGTYVTASLQKQSGW